MHIGLERTKRLMTKDRYESQLSAWNKFKSLLKIYEVTAKSAEKSAIIYDYLSQKGQLIEDDDILIAGIMNSVEIKEIISRNVDHFSRIPNIEVLKY